MLLGSKQYGFILPITITLLLLIILLVSSLLLPEMVYTELVRHSLRVYSIQNQP